jgi:hypothetical protein
VFGGAHEAIVSARKPRSNRDATLNLRP